jgi:prevent-host-death family protein
MSSKTVNSEEARVNLSEILDEVGQGGEVVIARYNKPVGVLIPHAQWLEMNRRRRARHQRIRKEMDDGKYYTMDQVESMLKQDGLLP